MLLKRRVKTPDFYEKSKTLPMDYYKFLNSSLYNSVDLKEKYVGIKCHGEKDQL